MKQLTQAQVLNNMIGLNDWILIADGDHYTGSFHAARLVTTQGVLINEIDLSDLAQFWLIGQYFFGNIYDIYNKSGYTILAYNDGTKGAVLV